MSITRAGPPAALPRRFLFLQGPPTPFWSELGREVMRQGAGVVQVSLSLGDRINWGAGPSLNYRGRFADWPAFIERLMRDQRITDVVLYADRQPYHAVAGSVARRLGIYVNVVEFGYLRPDWLTLERDGMSAYSHFPTDPEIIRELAKDLPAPDLIERYKHRFEVEAFHEVLYNLSAYLGWPLYPGLRADKYYNPVLDYLSYIPRLLASGRRNRRAHLRTRRWLDAGHKYIIMPLQMQSDYQLRSNAPFAHQKEAIEAVLVSLARHAPQHLRIVFKIHPLDNGWERWSHVVGRITGRLDIARRASAIDGGHLPTLLRHAQGAIVINSTVGIHALINGSPVKVLGSAVYDIAGLTHQGSLDSFWSEARPPDPALRDAFLKLLAASIQVKGSFYHRDGRRVAAEECARRMIAREVNRHGAFVDPPPRLAHCHWLPGELAAWQPLVMPNRAG